MLVRTNFKILNQYLTIELVAIKITKYSPKFSHSYIVI